MVITEKKKNGGMSYLEIVLAAAIISYVVIAFAQVFMKNNASLTKSTLQTLAYNYAADRMEEIKSYYYADITTSTFSNETAVLGENKSFTSTVSISELETGLKEVEVLVSWTELGENKEARVVSYVADYSDE